MSSGDRMDARQSSDSASIDDLFRNAVGRTPGAWALVDPSDREQFTDAAPRRLTYADAERAVQALADRLRDLGLPACSVVAFQMPNIVESVIALLAIVRSGLIAAPMPLLWREADAVAALGSLAPRALIGVRRVGTVDHGALVMQVAAELFSVRFVCGFGAELPDGVVPLDDVFDAATGGRSRSRPDVVTAQDIAVVTFDVTARGIVPVAHSHAELVAAGNAIVAAAGMMPGSSILGGITTSSFVGLSSVIMPWLIAGGRLALNQPFSPETFAAQLLDEHCDTAVVPAAILAAIQEARLLAPASTLRALLALWRSPEFLSAAAPWANPVPTCIDVAAFGEAGIIARRRGPDGLPEGIPIGPLAEAAIEVARTATGTLAIRGPMVPARAPAGNETGEPRSPKIDAEGFVDTEYPCRLDRDSNTLIVSGPPAGLINVGGYRFAWRELQDLLTELGAGGSLASLPDRLTGHRLAGVAADRESIRSALAARGVNPLLVAAFRDRR